MKTLRFLPLVSSFFLAACSKEDSYTRLEKRVQALEDKLATSTSKAPLSKPYEGTFVSNGYPLQLVVKGTQATLFDQSVQSGQRKFIDDTEPKFDLPGNKPDYGITIKYQAVLDQWVHVDHSPPPNNTILNRVK